MNLSDEDGNAFSILGRVRKATMSKTYDIACHDCRVVLWIGQESLGSNHRIYSTEEDLRKQRDFFYGHIGHRLEFNDGEVLSAKYDFKSLDFEEEEE